MKPEGLDKLEIESETPEPRRWLASVYGLGFRVEGFFWGGFRV